MTKSKWEEEFNKYFFNIDSPYYVSCPKEVKEFIRKTINQSQIEALKQVREKIEKKSWVTEGHTVVCMADIYDLIDQQIKEIEKK